ncbi:MAG: hypothetical protein PUB42_02415 [Firmicutes bacterium]|nr:hypothetical protein [Bacillota bacterium]
MFIRCTGHKNKPILDNLKYIASCGKSIEIRIPYVPLFNDNQIEKIVAFLSKIKTITKIRLLPYHNYARSKYNSLDMVNTLPQDLPNKDALQKAEDLLKNIKVLHEGI